MKIDTIIKSLGELTINHEIDEIQQVFEENTIRLGSMINSTPLDRNIKIYKINSVQNIKFAQKDFYKLGLKKIYEENILILEITDEYPEFFPIFLLREVYLRFVPFKLKDFKNINIFINQFIQEDLSHLKLVEKWKVFVEKQVINKKLLDAHMDRIDMLFKKKDNASDSNPRTFFFEYVRRNVMEIKENDKEFYEKLYRSYLFEGNVSLRDEGVLKTIRDLFIIFNKVKSYRGLLNYKRYFQDFKNDGTLKTDLSLTKFVDNVKWISDFTHLAPNYSVKYEAFNFRTIGCLFIFHPAIKPSSIKRLIDNMPFFTYSLYSLMNFSVNVFGFFLIPEVNVNDLVNFLVQMKDNDYLLNFILLYRNDKSTGLNLNYFKRVYERGLLTDPRDDEYFDDLLLVSSLTVSDFEGNSEPSLLDFLILDRVRYYSITGLPFERRSETLKHLKEDYYKKNISEERHISIFKNSLNKIKSSPQLVQEFINLINLCLRAQYFTIREFLNDFFILRESLQVLIKTNNNINNINDLLEFLNDKTLLNSFLSTKILKNEVFKKFVIKKLSFISNINEKEYIKKDDQYNLFLEFLDSCLAFNIIDNALIKEFLNNDEFSEQFIDYKKKELKIKFKKAPLLTLSSDSFEDKLEVFTTKLPLILFPCMITTLATTPFVSKTFYLLLLEYDDTIQSKISQIRSFFPKYNIINAKDNLIYFDFYLPTIQKEEKLLLFLAIITLFKTNIIYFKRLFTTGILKPFDLTDNYDFIKKEYHHSKTLFSQYLKFIKNLIPEKKSFENKIQYLQDYFTIPQTTFYNLVGSVNKRISREENNFNFKDISSLQQFHQNIDEYILGNKDFKYIKSASFFKNYIDKISFIPNFSAFGLAQFYLYIKPLDFSKIDFKLLLSNTFQRVESTVSIDHAPTFLIKYIFPFENPNKTYINRIVKVDKNISEYCLFSIDRLYQVLYFEKNLSSRGWDSNTKISELFKLHALRILFEPQRRREELKLKTFSFSESHQLDMYGTESEEFKQLMEIYSIGAINLKRFMNDINFFKKIETLTSKNLLFFYLRLKNLDMKERLTIILPRVDEKYNKTLLRIFSFFNDCFIFRIKGEYYIRDASTSDIKEFKNGLMIKLRLPSLELSNLRETFSEIFETLGIDHYLILIDLINFDFMIKQLFPNEDLENYNPLNNLIWDKKNKKWKNVKLFGEDVTKKIYPSIL